MNNIKIHAKTLLMGIFIVWIIGLIGYWGMTASTYETLHPSLLNRILIIEGRVVGLPSMNPAQQIQRFNFAVERTYQSDEDGCPQDFLVRLSWRLQEDMPLINADERWRLVVKLRAPNGQASPDAYNFEDWLFMHHLQATGYVLNQYVAERLGTVEWRSIHSVRQSLTNHISKHLQPSIGRALVKALVLGDRSELPPNIWHILASTGTSHLLAISGLHIGLVALFFGFIFSWLWRRSERACLYLPAPTVGVVSALFMACIYAALAGFSIPTERAFIMLLLFACAFLKKRFFPPWFVLFVAFILIASLHPRSMLSAGFVLSFLAVAILISLVKQAPQNRFWQLVRVQGALVLIMMPIVNYYFGMVSFSAPLVNLIAIPIVGWLLVPMALIGVVILPLTDALLTYSAVFLEYLTQFLEWVAKWPYARVLSAKPSMIFSILSMGLLWGAVVYTGKKRHRIALLLLGIACLIPWHKELPKGQAEVAVLDVGQGLAVIVSTRHHRLVYDTGRKGMGERVVSPALHYFSNKTPDIIAVSHPDIDHRGGLAILHLRYPKAKLVGIGNCQGQWKWDGVDFRWLVLSELKGNNLSCVLQIKTAKDGMLLTGDIEKKAEKQLMRNHDLSAEWLLSPHHGSKTSSHDGFLQAVKPHSVVISAGHRSRYGHPHSVVLERYDRHALKIYNTACSGTIIIRLGRDDTMPVAEWRKEHPRFWRRQCG